jgi:hypothetical protein
MGFLPFLAPWVIGKDAGDALELAFVFVFIVGGLFLLYLFGQFWQE